jgi:23S rRNA (guanosine2251-2'-O)-methyltransferase
MVVRSAGGKSSGRAGRNRPGDWIWGRRVVLETLRAGRWPIRDLWISEGVDADVADEVRRLAAGLGVEVQQADAGAIRARCHTDQHQGVLARVGEYSFRSLESLLEEAADPPLWLLLDAVQDPHNLGAILRSAEVLGVDGVVVSGDHAPISGHVARSSAGAANHVRLARSENPVALIMRLRREEVTVLAASSEESPAARGCDLAGPLALVVGNEGHGVAEDLLAVCDGRIGIEQSGRIESLNVAVAVGVLLYEVDRQRRDAQDGTACSS